MKVVQRRDRLQRSKATAVFVVHDEPDLVRETMLTGLDVPFPVLIDREREAYRSWGLGRASLATIFLDPKVWWSYARLLARGERMRRSGRDPLQLGGDFIVGPDGHLAYARPQRRDDRPAVGRLLETIDVVAD